MYTFPKCFEVKAAVKAFKEMTADNFNDLLNHINATELNSARHCVAISLNDWQFDTDQNAVKRSDIVARFVAVFESAQKPSYYFTKIVTIKWRFNTSSIDQISISHHVM